MSLEALTIKSAQDTAKIKELTEALDAVNKKLAEITEKRVGELKADIMARSTLTEDQLKHKSVEQLQTMKIALDSAAAPAQAASVKATLDGRAVTAGLTAGRYKGKDATGKDVWES